MQGFPHRTIRAFVAIFILSAGLAAAEDAPSSIAIVISVAEQKLALLRDGGLLKKYPISTSKYGIGDSYGSYKTPLGKLRVCEKIGEELASGSVIKERHATGEVLPANAPGRDPIVTRILWLDGLEEQNHNARSRGIYIHGTTEEGKIGKPVSYGCIRMRSQDVLDVFEQATIDTQVLIIPDKFPHFSKYVPPKPQIIAAVRPPKPTPAPAAPAPAPVVASATQPPAKKIAASTAPAPAAAPLAPIAEYHPPAVDRAPHGSVTVSNVSNSTVAHAMEGSILSAGLPDGPKIPTLPEPPAPKDVARFGRLTPPPARESAFSLQDPGTDLKPAIQAADDAANAHPAPQEPESTDSTAKPSSHLAFRANSSDTKAKP